MKSAIFSVGTEILFGQITNTNTVYLSQKLNQMGIDVLYHETVGDNPGRVKEVLSRLLIGFRTTLLQFGEVLRHQLLGLVKAHLLLRSFVNGTQTVGKVTDVQFADAGCKEIPCHTQP